MQLLVRGPQPSDRGPSPVSEDNQSLLQQGVTVAPMDKTRGSSLRAAVITAVVLALALAAALLGLGITGWYLSLAQAAPAISPECLHALGGGVVAPGGGFDHRVVLPQCSDQLQAYAAPGGPYWHEVALAAAEGIESLGLRDVCSSSNAAGAAVEPTQQPALPRALQKLQVPQPQHCLSQPSTVVTSRTTTTTTSSSSSRSSSGSSSSTTRPQLPPPSKEQLVVFDIDETVLSNMPFILHPGNSSWDDWVAAAAAPPLLPTRCLYLSLQAAGYSVAFITGRGERSRDNTLKNLEQAGFGQPCQGNGSIPALGPNSSSSSSSSGASGASSSRRSLARAAAASGPAPAAEPGAAAAGAGVEPPPQCFAALLMRPPGDTRIASVYKPWARKQLLAALNQQLQQAAGGGGATSTAAAGSNMTLLALVGDQFSDLNGELSAPQAFKLPNSFYYIL